MNFEHQLDVILFEGILDKGVINENVLGLVVKGLYGTVKTIAKGLFNVAVEIATPLSSLALRGMAKLANLVARDLDQTELPPKDEVFAKIDKWVRKYGIPSDAANKMKEEVGIVYRYA